MVTRRHETDFDEPDVRLTDLDTDEEVEAKRRTPEAVRASIVHGLAIRRNFDGRNFGLIN